MCTANQCRSPMGEALLRGVLDERGIEADVHSAGLLRGGAPATVTARAVVAERGLDLGFHRSRRFTPEMVDGADLVLAMAREHVREVVLASPESWSKTFTLKELVRRAELVGPRRGDEPLAVWLDRVAEGRTRTDMLGASDEDDVADPIGRPAEDYRRTIDELDDLIGRVVDLAWPRVTVEPR